MAEWKTTNEQVAAVAKEPGIEAVLAAVNTMDAALVRDGYAAFAALLAKDLVVNNPQNGISISVATGRRNSAGLISYSSCIRSIEYAGMRGEMVLLMGGERVMPKEIRRWPGKRFAGGLPICEEGRWPLGADCPAVDNHCVVRMD